MAAQVKRGKRRNYSGCANMIPFWPGMIEASEEKGWRDGSACAPYSPLLEEGLSPDADDAYATAYFAGLAYGGEKK